MTSMTCLKITLSCLSDYLSGADGGISWDKWVSTTLDEDLGAVSIRKTVLPGMAIPMLKIRRSNGRLIFNMEIAIRR